MYLNYFTSITLLNTEEKKKLYVITTAVALVCAYFSMKRLSHGKNNNESSKEIPLARNCLPIVGHFLCLRSGADRTIGEWHKELGPVLKFKLGIQTWISVNDPKLAHKLLSTLGAKTSFRYHTGFIRDNYFIDENSKGIAFTQPNHDWKKARIAGGGAFSPKQVDKHIEFIYQESNILVDYLIKETENNQENGVYTLEYLNFFAMNVTTKIGFGKRFESPQDPGFIKLNQVCKSTVINSSISNNLRDFMPIFSIIDFFTCKYYRMKKFIKNQRDPIFLELIEEARNRDDINIIKTIDENDDNLSDNGKIVLMTDLTIAGSDAVSVTLSWIFVIMCNYPEVQKKAAEEIDAFIQSNKCFPLFHERLQLPFCISLLKECMRYKTNQPFGIPRRVFEDVDLDGYVIPKGAVIAPHVVEIHKHPDFYHDPNTFNPERYLDNLRTMYATTKGRFDDRDHFTFGWGRRSCPAAYLAEVEIFSIFIAIMAKCFIEPSAKGIPSIDEAITLGLNNWPLPFTVKFTTRPNSLNDIIKIKE